MNGITYTTQSDGSVKVTGTLDEGQQFADFERTVTLAESGLEIGKNYVLSDVNAERSTAYEMMYFYDSEMQGIRGTPPGSIGFQNGWGDVVFIVPENTAYVKYAYRVEDYSTDPRDSIMYPTVSEGTEPLPYSPYPMD